MSIRIYDTVSNEGLAACQLPPCTFIFEADFPDGALNITRAVSCASLKSRQNLYTLDLQRQTHATWLSKFDSTFQSTAFRRVGLRFEVAAD